MLAIRNLEVHLAHSCNLACESCSHYSNQGHKGLLDLAEAEQSWAAWADRLAPRSFSLLGGEPAIHPDFAAFVPLARRMWPEAHIRIVTNGFLLSRHPDLPRRLAEAGNAKLTVSIHHGSEAYLARLEPVIALLNRWRAEYGIQVGAYKSALEWTRRYKGVGAAMEPFADGDPAASWGHCPARYCPQIFDSAIWKCPPLAYLPMQHAKYGLGEAWRPYLDYAPLRSGCSDAELHAFFARGPEAACGMCPANPEHFALPLPFPEPRQRALSADLMR